jgi:hypothetical protein
MTLVLSAIPRCHSRLYLVPTNGALENLRLLLSDIQIQLEEGADPGGGRPTISADGEIRRSPPAPSPPAPRQARGRPWRARDVMQPKEAWHSYSCMGSHRDYRSTLRKRRCYHSN